MSAPVPVPPVRRSVLRASRALPAVGACLALFLGPVPAPAATGERLYEVHCSSCHGVAGDGRGDAAARMAPPPRDFTTGSYEFRSTAYSALPTDADILRTIERGVPGTEMPAFGALLLRSEMEAIVPVLKAFSPRFSAEGAAAPVEAAPEPPDGPESRARGKALYDESSCATCHGDLGRGDGPSAATLTDEAGRPVRPADLTRGPRRAGPSSLDTWRTLSTGLAGTPMRSAAKLVPDPADRWHLAHYVDSLLVRKGRAWRAFHETPFDPARAPAPSREPERGKEVSTP